MTKDNEDALLRADEICQYHRRGYETEDQAKLRRQESHKAAAAHLRRLVAENEAKDALLRQAVEALEQAKHNTTHGQIAWNCKEAIATIRQHLES